MATQTNKAILLAFLGAAAGSAVAGEPLVTLFSEDFESFPLTVNQEEGVAIGTPACVVEAFLGDGVICGGPNLNTECGEPPLPATIDCADFSNTPFDGTWTYNGWRQLFGYDWDGFGGTAPAQPGVGCAEWQGWTVADRDFWLSADLQLREEFTKAQGRVLIADPDEWDDYDPFGIDPDSTGVFNTTFTSPEINIDGVTENTVIIRFDSSWRPEDTQKAAVSVSFDGGSFTQVLLFESDETSPDFKPDATNETVELAINNPLGANTMEIQFEMFDATNDWWWAVDNIQVAGEGGEPIEPPSEFNLSIEQFNDTTVVPMSWTQALNAVEYEVIFANDADFNDVVISQITTELSFENSPTDLAAGAYFVKVVARNDLGTSEQTARVGVDNNCFVDLKPDGTLNFFDVSVFLQLFSQDG